MNFKNLGSLGNVDVLLFPLLVVESIGQRTCTEVADRFVKLNVSFYVFWSESYIFLVDTAIEVEVYRKDLVDLIEVVD